MTVNNSNRPFWYFKTGNPWSQEPNDEWIKYRDIEMEIIEEAYQQVKCELGSTREERFYSSLSLTSNTSYGKALAWCPFLTEWLKIPAGRRIVIDFSSAIDAYIKGIIEEAEIYKSHSVAEANWMVEKLRACKTKPRREASKARIHLYTHESFLYHVLNTALRDEDYFKLDTLGPLCFLIRDYSRTCTEFIGTVYRGVQLSISMLQSYKKAIGSWRTWPSYTSTSKNREMAAFRGNTLFIIEISNIKLGTVRAYDVADISYFPSEEEVLLPAGISFRVVSVEQDAQQNYIINIKL